MDLRFFEIYRNSEYILLLVQGAGMSAALTIIGGIFGLGFAVCLAITRHNNIP